MIKTPIMLIEELINLPFEVKSPLPRTSLFDWYKEMRKVHLLVRHLRTENLENDLIENILLENIRHFKSLFLRMIKNKSECEKLLSCITDGDFIKKWEEKHKDSYYFFLDTIVVSSRHREVFYEIGMKEEIFHITDFMSNLIWDKNQKIRNTHLGGYILNRIASDSNFSPLEIKEVIWLESIRWESRQAHLDLFEALTLANKLRLLNIFIKKGENTRISSEEDLYNVILTCLKHVYSFIKEDKESWICFSGVILSLNEYTLSPDDSIIIDKDFPFENSKQFKIPLS